MTRQPSSFSRLPVVIATLLSRYYYRQKLLLPTTSYFSTTTHLTSRPFRSKEENELYLKLTSAFREKLAEKTSRTTKFYTSIIDGAVILPAGAAGKGTTPSLLTVEDLEELWQRIDTAGRNRDVEVLDRLLDEAQRSRVRAVTTYNRLVKSYLQCGRLDRADATFAALHQNHILPTTRTFTLLINAHISRAQFPTSIAEDDDNRGVPEQAMRYLDEMRTLSLKPCTSFDYCVLLRLHARRDDVFAMEFLWRDLQASKDIVRPFPYVYAAYLPFVVASRKDVRRAIDVWREMYERVEAGTGATGGGSSLMFGQCVALVPVVDAFAGAEFATDAHALLGYLLSCTASSSATAASAKGSRAGFVVPAATYVAILRAYVAQGKSRMAVEFYREMGVRYGVTEEALGGEAAEVVKKARESVKREREEEERRRREVGYGMFVPAGWTERGGM
ncbi:hypothetical protein BC938DRAFT_480911 [Jimgerdemannia flammicorona]|uniref:Pentacotripeptide-repeat region of PRORP domain-containing protein n=1 Tax=Jimgerdemannia flammicorona TaxID=994334 RepID=A0A433QHC4_9FUNG|nr:hypothetical protein BC938DRAFT_480911 [Jimgerdemannia flammicorona]